MILKYNKNIRFHCWEIITLESTHCCKSGIHKCKVTSWFALNRLSTKNLTASMFMNCHSTNLHFRCLLHVYKFSIHYLNCYICYDFWAIRICIIILLLYICLHYKLINFNNNPEFSGNSSTNALIVKPKPPYIYFAVGARSNGRAVYTPLLINIITIKNCYIFCFHVVFMTISASLFCTQLQE